jgi:carbohydrate-selective porin OprB
MIASIPLSATRVLAWSSRPERRALQGGTSIGIALAEATLGAPGRAARAANGEQTANVERIWELALRYRFADWLAIQADVQRVTHPNRDATLDAALVFGLRVNISRGWTW